MRFSYLNRADHRRLGFRGPVYNRGPSGVRSSRWPGSSGPPPSPPPARRTAGTATRHRAPRPRPRGRRRRQPL